MKNVNKVIGLIIMCLLISTMSFAQDKYIIKSSKTTVSGTSNIHDWVSDITTVNASGTIDISNGRVNNIDKFTVTIPVKSIVSSKGSIMDNKTHGALKANKYPNIYFELTSATPLENKKFNVKGNLTIAGVKKAVSFDVYYKVYTNGTASFNGTEVIKMTDYNIDPPTALMGALTTGDTVSINFDVTVKPVSTTSEK